VIAFVISVVDKEEALKSVGIVSYCIGGGKWQMINNDNEEDAR